MYMESVLMCYTVKSSYLLLPMSFQKNHWKYFSWKYSHSCLKVKYSVRCLHSWLPLRRNNVLGYRIFKTHKYKTHCKRKCFQWIFLKFYLTMLIFASFNYINLINSVTLYYCHLIHNNNKLYEIRDFVLLLLTLLEKYLANRRPKNTCWINKSTYLRFIDYLM